MDHLVAPLRALVAAHKWDFFGSIGLDPAAAHYLRQPGWPFLTGLVADQSVRSVVAWSLPWNLSKRTGEDILANLRRSSVQRLVDAIAAPPALHRYPKATAARLHNLYAVCESLLGDRPEAIWEGHQSVASVRDRLMSLPGIGPKKATVGVLLLMSEFDVSFAGAQELPLAVDVHVRRVLERYAGPSHATVADWAHLARQVMPSAPGRLSTPLWKLGAEFCRPKDPACDQCPLSGSCVALHGS